MHKIRLLNIMIHFPYEFEFEKEMLVYFQLVNFQVEKVSFLYIYNYCLWIFFFFF